MFARYVVYQFYKFIGLTIRWLGTAEQKFFYTLKWDATDRCLRGSKTPPATYYIFSDEYNIPLIISKN